MFKRKVILRLVLVMALIFGVFVFVCENYTVPILMYHHIAESPQRGPNWVAPSEFRRHMQFLQDHGFHVISVDAYIEGKEQYRRFPFKTVAITFDDGNDDNFENAYPILKEFSYPAIMFVSSNRIGTPEYMTWRELDEMQDFAITTGSHTLDHLYLPDIEDREELADQIVLSKKMIEDKLGVEVKHFCYPIGGFTPQVKEIVRKSGYHSAFTTNRGYASRNQDLFELKRVRLNGDDSDLELWVKLSGLYNTFRSPKDPY